MKKMIKLSLVAAVAVAGLSTSAVAGSLEEAIKDTTISGKFLVGYNAETEKKKNATKTSTNEWEYDIDVTLNTKVNDMVTAQFGVEADHEIQTKETSTDKNKGNEIGITKLNFIVKTDVATAIVGKQKVGTQFFDDERADGVVALVPAGPVTLAAAHFTGINSSGTDASKALQLPYTDNNGVSQSASADLYHRDISAVAALGAAGPVNFAAWYIMTSQGQSATLNTIEQGINAYSLNITGKFGPASVEVNHASAEIQGKTGYDFDAETLTKVVASVEAGPVTVIAGMGMTNDSSSTLDKHNRLHGVDFTADNDASNNFALELTKLDEHNDATAYLVGAVAAMGETTVSGKYLMATASGHDGAKDTDVTELDLEVAYAMSKNFSVSALYAMQNIDNGDTVDTDYASTQLSMNYKF